MATMESLASSGTPVMGLLKNIRPMTSATTRVVRAKMPMVAETFKPTTRCVIPERNFFITPLFNGGRNSSPQFTSPSINSFLSRYDSFRWIALDLVLITLAVHSASQSRTKTCPSSFKFLMAAFIRAVPGNPLASFSLANFFGMLTSPFAHFTFSS